MEKKRKIIPSFKHKHQYTLMMNKHADLYTVKQRKKNNCNTRNHKLSKDHRASVECQCSTKKNTHKLTHIHTKKHTNTSHTIKKPENHKNKKLRVQRRRLTELNTKLVGCSTTTQTKYFYNSNYNNDSNNKFRCCVIKYFQQLNGVQSLTNGAWFRGIPL